MASRIKGITVEIGGDTTGLDKALSGVDKEIKETSRNLKDVNKLLKFDPKNTNLLKQKQELLAKQIDSTKNRLNTLKAADKEAKRQLDMGELGKDKYDSLQREIAETQSSLKNLKKEKVTLDTKGLKTFGNAAEDVGKKMSVVSGAITAVGAASIGAAKELDSGYDTIVKATGATGKTLTGLKDVADDIYTSMATDMDTVGAAIGEVNTKFGATGKNAEELGKKFIKFAEITDSDVTSSIDSAYDIMQKWNLSQNDTLGLLDQIAGVAQETGIGVDELFSAVTDNADTLKQLNLDASSAVNLMAQFEKAGIDSATALKSMKYASKEAVKSGQTMDEFLSRNIEAMLGAKNQTEAMSIATETFGNKNASTMLAALKDGRLSLDDLKNSMSDYAGTVDETYQNTQDPWDKMTVAVNNVKMAGAELGAELAEKMVPVIEKLISVVQSVVQWWDGLSSGQKNTIETVALVIAAIGPLLLIVGKVIGVISMLTTVTTALNVSMLPITAIIVAIIAVVAAVIVVIKNWGAISEWIKKKFSQLKSALANIWNAIKTTITKVITGIKEKAVAVFTAIVNGIKEKINALKEAMSAIWNAIKNTIVNLVNGIKEKVVSIFNNIVSGIKEKVSGIATTIKNGFGKAINFIKNLPGQALEWGKDFMKGLADGIKKKATDVINGVKDIGKKIKNFLHFSRPDEGPLKDYETWMPDFMEGLASGITGNMDKIERAMKEVSGKMMINTTVKGNRASDFSNVNIMLAAILKAVQEGKVIKLDRREIGRIRV